MSHITSSDDVPLCTCGGLVRPDVVLYGEQLCNDTIDNAVNAIDSADMLIIGGTSLAVYPAAGLINYFRGRYLVVINRQSTPADNKADLVLHESIGAVLSKIDCPQ